MMHGRAGTAPKGGQRAAPVGLYATPGHPSSKNTHKLRSTPGLQGAEYGGDAAFTRQAAGSRDFNTSEAQLKTLACSRALHGVLSIRNKSELDGNVKASVNPGCNWERTIAGCCVSHIEGPSSGFTVQAHARLWVPGSQMMRVQERSWVADNDGVAVKNSPTHMSLRMACP